MEPKRTDSRKPQVVVVNDDVTQLNVLAGLLNRAGMEVQAYDSAEKALDAFIQGEPPDLIVTDLYMPVIDGWRFCRLLRSPEYAAFNQLPILVVSATFSGEETRRITADLGANAFLPAPVDARRFIAQARELLAGVLPQDHLRVLIVEDSQTLSGILRKSFEAHGYRADTALTAQAAVAAFTQSAYDVAVLDYHLPDGLGDSLLKGLKERLPDCVCIMMTTDPGPELALEWMRKGAAAYLRKPFEPEYLIEVCVAARRERALLRVQNLLEERTQELRENEKKYRELVENINDIVFTVDSQGLFTYVSPVAERIFGYTLADLIGQSFSRFIFQDDLPMLIERFHRVLAGEIDPADYRIVTRTGEVRWVRSSSRPVMVDGKAVAIRGVISDITQGKQAEEQVRQLQKAESLSRMAGAIAHHFNNQLGAVMGNLELAMIGLPRGAGAVENLTEAMQAARRAATVSGLMLTYLGQTRGKREPIDFSETCRQSLPMLQAAIPGEVVFKTDLPSPGPTIRADANQIQQVLTNLCTNAWEAVGDGRGVIHLIVKAVSAADIPAGPRFPLDWQPQETAYACLEVADAGCGIAGNDIEKLFDPFYSTKFAGRGLGLSVALGIVRTHGGVITVQSAPGHGSVFRVFFPASTEAVPRPPEKAAGAPELEGSGTVLLVEDDDLLRKTAAALLELLGFAVLAARDGVEALEVFRPRQGEIRFVLCDLTMPRMDGWETLAALRELAPAIPVILSSGHSEARVMLGDHPTLPEAFLSKPYGFKELREAIARALANKTS
jgi:PAS domain S-box-containing protein